MMVIKKLIIQNLIKKITSFIGKKKKKPIYNIA